MARQNGPLQLTGSLGGLSFYHNKKYGYLVRSKGGGKGKKVSPRTRENAQELGHASRTGKLIRRSLRAGLAFTGDATVSQRLNRCLSQILRLDTRSGRGERKVALGLERAEGKQLLRSFDFIEGLPLEKVLHVQPVYDTEMKAFVLKGFKPGRDLLRVAGVTHVELRGAIVFVDTVGDTCSVDREGTTVMRIDAIEEDVVLCTNAVPGSKVTGMRLEVFGVLFLQETSGELVGMESRCAGVV